MACVQPLYIKQNKKISSLGTYDSYKRNLQMFGVIRFDSQGYMYYRVPCGWCLNCRIDRRNWLEDSINYEYHNLYKDVGAFVTLTYDNYNILNNIVYEYDINGNKKIKLDNKKRPLLTVKLNDGIKYIKRIREKIRYNNLDCPVMRKDFKYIICTEYGEKRNRCHIHLLLLGLHYKQAWSLINGCWKKGIVDSGPIKNGGIRYVVDYMDKLPKGKQLQEQFNDIGLEPPKLKHSKGLGKILIFDNLDYILKNDLCYPVGAFNKNRPIPMYWKKVLLKRNENFQKYIQSIKKNMETYQIKKVNNNYDFNTMNKFVAEEAFKRHKKLETQIRNKGNVPPYVIYQEYGDKHKEYLQQCANNALEHFEIPF